MRVVISLVLCVAATAFADIPQTKAGRPALERYAAAKAKLDADYQARLAALNRQLATELRAAIKQATRNGDLADAQALQEYLDKLVGRTYTFQIDAAKDWQPTIEVKKGQRIVIEAEGEWHYGVRVCGPEGRGRYYYLEGRIGDRVFRIGAGTELQVAGDGTLEMRMKDGVFTDNSGHMLVTIYAQ